MREVKSVTSAILVLDDGRRSEEWCINGNHYYGKTGWTEAQARWAFENNNSVMADAKRAVPDEAK